VTRLVLIRHGETDWNAEGRWQGQADIPLNTQGVSASERLAQELVSYPLDAIYSSDLIRARQTAQALARAKSMHVKLEPRLREIDQGEWQGLLINQIQSLYTDVYLKRLQDPWQVAPPGGETALQVRNRVIEAVDEILTCFPGGTVAIISHGFTLAMIRVHFQSLPLERIWEMIPGNLELIKINIRDN